MFDLVGMARKDSRSKVKVTMLKRSQGWASVNSKLVGSLMTETSQLPAQPDTILIYGEHAKDKLVRIVGADDFTHEIIHGLDSDKMPWRAW